MWVVLQMVSDYTKINDVNSENIVHITGKILINNENYLLNDGDDKNSSNMWSFKIYTTLIWKVFTIFFRMCILQARYHLNATQKDMLFKVIHVKL